jgi:hypothetical protein
MSVLGASLGYGPDRDRCTAVDDVGVRRQLQPHIDGKHCAMDQFDVVGARGKRRPVRTRYRKFGRVWTKPEPGQEPCPGRQPSES